MSGRSKLILDGDFIRLNKLANDHERKTVISLHILAGGPVSVSDRYNSIGNNLWLYQNNELLALHVDGFVGKPLTNDPTAVTSQIWKGQMSNGDWIVGLFNREDTEKQRSIDFSSLNITGNALVRDLWQHADLGSMDAYTVNIPPHGCVILKIVPDPDTGGSIESGAIYKITNRNSGKVLDVYQQSIANGAVIHQWDYAAVNSQHWKITSNSDSTYMIMNMNSSKNLDVYQQLINDNVQIHQWEPISTASQKWRILSVGDGYFKVENANSNKALDVYGGATTNGTLVKQFLYTGGLNQQWLLEKLP